MWKGNFEERSVWPADAMASDSAWKDQGSSGQFEVPGELNRSDLLWHLLSFFYNIFVNILPYILGLIQV